MNTSADDPDTTPTVYLNVTYPNGTRSQYTMVHISGKFWQYNLTGAYGDNRTWGQGLHNLTTWVSDGSQTNVSDKFNFTVDANTISMNKLGRAFPNAPMLAAAAAATKILEVNQIIESFKNYFKKKLVEDILQKNLDVMQEAAKEVKGL